LIKRYRNRRLPHWIVNTALHFGIPRRKRNGDYIMIINYKNKTKSANCQLTSQKYVQWSIRTTRQCMCMFRWNQLPKYNTRELVTQFITRSLDTYYTLKFGADKTNENGEKNQKRAYNDGRRFAKDWLTKTWRAVKLLKPDQRLSHESLESSLFIIF